MTPSHESNCPLCGLDAETLCECWVCAYCGARDPSDDPPASWATGINRPPACQVCRELEVER